MATTEGLTHGFDFTRPAFDFVVRLVSATENLDGLANRASSTEEYYRLTEKKDAVSLSINTWYRIVEDYDVAGEPQHWADMQEATESKYRTTTGGEREGYALVLDYLRAVPTAAA